MTAAVTECRLTVAEPPCDPVAVAVLARFVLRDVTCVVVPAAAAVTACLGAFELAGQRYVVVKVGEKIRRDLLDLLTPRELEIALLVSAGQECKAVARRLRISFHTVRVHLGRIYAKLGLHKQTELTALVAARYATGRGAS